MDENFSGSQSLVAHVQNKRFHHLLHHLRRCHTKQAELDQALHASTREGQVEAARLLIEYGANIRSLNAKGAPLLLGAVLGDHTDIITLLVIYHYDVNYAIGDSIDTGIGVPLHIAIWKQNVQMVRVLVGSGVALETRDQDGNTALLVSAYVGNTEIAEMLLKAGCDTNAQDSIGNSVVHIAVATTNMDMLNLALEYASVPDMPNDDGDTPFLLSVKYRNKDMMERILKERDVDIHHISHDGSNALHYACAAGDCDIVEMLLTIDLDLQHVDRFGNTPLLVSSCVGHENIILSLLPRLKKNAITKIGFNQRNLLHWSVIYNMESVFRFAVECACFDLDLTDSDGYSALVLAIKHRRLEMVDTLLRVSCNVAPKDCEDYCPSHWAVESGDTAILQLLIDRGANLHTVNKRIENSLVLAVKLGHVDMVKMILDSVCDTDRAVIMKQKDVDRCSCIHIAAEKGHIGILTQLLEHSNKELLESLNRHFETALAVAGREYSRDILLILIRRGCSVDVLDNQGKSPLYHAVANKDMSVVEELISRHASPNLNESESTPLIEACKRELTGIVSLLLCKGAYVDQTDKHGRSALIWASQKGYTDILDLLLEYNANPRLVDISGDTALTVGAFAGQLPVLQKLIPISEVNHVENEENMTALLLALSQEKKECALFLLEQGVDINCLASNGNNALITATATNIGAEVIRNILVCGQPIDVNQSGAMGRGALHWAVADPQTLAALLEHSPLLDTADEHGATPLLLAIAHRMEQSCKLLVNAGSNVRLVHDDGRQPIHHAAIYGTNKLLSTLLQSGIDADVLTLDGRSPILLACIEGNTECVKTLIRHGASIDRVFFDAITPLSVATNERNYETMEVLLEAGANPELIGTKKHRPLLSCVLNNDIEGVKILLRWGSDMDFSANWMTHPIVVAAMNQRWDILDLLLRTNQNVNVVRNILQNGALLYFVADENILNQLKIFVRRPVSLVKLCVKTIRNQIKRPLKTNLSLLPVPQKIRETIANIQ